MNFTLPIFIYFYSPPIFEAFPWTKEKKKIKHLQVGINFHSQPESCFHLSIYSLLLVALMISWRIKTKATSVILLHFDEHETCKYSHM